ncbi:dimethylarginine dimethylaminohydrolase [Brucella tritici]|uniref:Dimethylarginine dimethylaminohydrolase n=1 Tax=Brucella tritici TaxID=94626 RepID=A0A833FJG0_9HYPH|nr:arginine deiminase family protein [Brucella tritici]KAB2664022.1 dimethylarginine dimethylaminohydrolase [Brucella tritici]
MTAVYEFNSAIVRTPGRSVINGLRADNRGNPTYEGVKEEHEAYVQALRQAGVEVTVLPPMEEFPDSIFVEDPALVFHEGAVLLRPGAPTRVGETAEIELALRSLFERVVPLPSPGFADGGDVLVTPSAVMIGLSARTDKSGAEGLRAALATLDHAAEIVETPKGVLHFKTDCSLLDEETVLATHRLAGSGFFRGLREIVTPEGEEAAANALRVNDVVFVGADYPRTIDLLDKKGYKVVALKTEEIGRIDAGLSCMSLRWRR